MFSGYFPRYPIRVVAAVQLGITVPPFPPSLPYVRGSVQVWSKCERLE